MNRDDVIRMAREAWTLEFIPDSDVSKLEHFASLVAATEREEFLKWCEVNIEEVMPKTDWAKGYVMALKNVAEGFRARGNQ